MFIRLVESQRRSTRSVGGTAASVVLHSVVIFLAVAATANARTQREPHNPGIKVTFMAQSTPAPKSPKLVRQPSTSTLKPSYTSALPVSAPVAVATGIPETPPLATSSAPTGSGAAPSPASGDHPLDVGSSGPLTQWQVDREVRPFASNMAPVYPDVLRSRGIDGEVYARFVVGENGRVDMKTLEIMNASSAQFANSVRYALERARFQPAEAGGRKVAQLVEQRFQFRLDR